MVLRTSWLKRTTTSVQSEMTLGGSARHSSPRGGGGARKPFVRRVAAFSLVQRRLAGPTDQKLLCPSTSGVLDSAGTCRCPRGHSAQSELVLEQLSSQGLAGSGPGLCPPAALCSSVLDRRLQVCCLVQTWTPQPPPYHKQGMLGLGPGKTRLCSTSTRGAHADRVPASRCLTPHLTAAATVTEDVLVLR